MDRKAVVELTTVSLAAFRKHFPGGDPTPDAWHFGAVALASYLAEQPEFTEEPLYLLQLTQSARLDPENTAASLLYAAHMTDQPVVVVDMFLRLLSREKFSLTNYSEIYGIEPPEGGVRVGGSVILPWNELPDGVGARAAMESYSSKINRPFSAPSAVAIHTTDPVEIIGVAGDSARHLFDLADRIRGRTKSIVARFTAIDNCYPIISKTWSEYTDRTLQYLSNGVGFSMPTTEGHTPWGAVKIDQNNARFVESTFNLDDRRQNLLDLACERLNLAQRRLDLGDRAVEAAICLETLLGDSQTTELTYRLKLRAALLLETDIEERRRVKAAVGLLYAVRSSRVHGEKVPHEVKKKPASEILRDGVDICRRVIQKIATLERLPNWEDWELSGGEPSQPKT